MRVLFICSANSYRSQIAAAVFRNVFNGRHQVDSAGLSPNSNGLRVRELVDEDVLDALRGDGIEIGDNQCKMVNNDLLERSDIVFTMERAQMDELRGRFPQFSAKVHVLKEFIGGAKDADILNSPSKIETYKEIRRAIEELGRKHLLG